MKGEKKESKSSCFSSSLFLLHHISFQGCHLLCMQVMLTLFPAADLVQLTPDLDVQHPTWFHQLDDSQASQT